jgi:hypothetical protein
MSAMSAWGTCAVIPAMWSASLDQTLSFDKQVAPSTPLWQYSAT